MNNAIRNLARNVSTDDVRVRERNDFVVYNINETRKKLGGISTPTIYKLINLGLLKPTKILRRTMFSEQAIAECLKKSTRQ